MNVLTFKFGNLTYTDGSCVVKKLDDRFGFDRVICIEKSPDVEKIRSAWKGSNLTLIDYFTEVKCFKYRDINVRDMPPLPRETLEKLSLHRCHLYNMHRDETLTFRMLDEDIQNCFQYWNYVLGGHSVDLVLLNGVPHAIYSYSLYAMCKAKGIKVFFIGRTCVPGYSVCRDDIYDKFERLEEAYKAAVEEKDDYPLSEYMSACYAEKMEDDSYRPPPANKKSRDAKEKNWRKRFKMNRTAQKIVRVGEWNRHIGNELRERREEKIRNATLQHYNSLAHEPDYSSRYIYFPLHYQPEETSSPLGNVYVDLYYLVKTLAFCVRGTDIKIYVKEHGVQANVLRLSRKRLYDNMHALPEVELININESTYKLQEHCIASATCTGTTVMESLFKGKPVFVFGSQVNNLAPNAYIITDVNSCREALREILDGRFSVGVKERNAFLYAFEKTCIRGFYRSHFAEAFGLSQDENAENVYKELGERINEWNLSFKG